MVAVVQENNFIGVVAEREEQAVRALQAIAKTTRWAERADLPDENDAEQMKLARGRNNTTKRVANLTATYTHPGPTDALQTDTGFPHKGTLDYVSPTLNQSTGTIAVRGILKNADRVLFTEQTFQEFPDYWMTTTAFASPKKLTDANPQISEYAWGSKTLVDYTVGAGKTAKKMQATLPADGQTLDADWISVLRFGLPAQKDAAVGYFGGANWAPNLDNAANKKFVADFRAKFNRDPASYAGLAYDAMMLIDAAVQGLGVALARSGLVESEITAGRPALKLINKTNVKKLAPVWNFSLMNDAGELSSPAVYDGVLYVTGLNNTAWALDARTGRTFWRYRRQLPEDLRVCCGPVNRGFGVLAHRLLGAKPWFAP